MYFRAIPLLAVLAAAASSLVGCASTPVPPLPAASPADAPARWQAPLPGSAEPAEMRAWWGRFGDPLLVELIDAAQAVSPTIASAASRIAQARATRVGAGAALLPSLDANANEVRGKQDFISGLATSSAFGLQASWELDLFGGQRAARDAAQARAEGAGMAWHDARIAVAATVASSYTDLRACEAQVEQRAIDAHSRAETARLTGLSYQAGFEAPASAALARASAAQGNSLVIQQRQQCDLIVKSLVALAGIDEPTLRSKLASGTARVPQPAEITFAAVPGQALAQRPDLIVAENDVIAAAADVSQAQAARLPRITLAGSMSASRVESSFGAGSGQLWAIGPLTITLPLFDGGTRRANLQAAQARYLEATALYRGKLRTAISEVEQALVTLNSATERGTDARTASEGYAMSFRAAEARYKGGLGSLFELEDARRSQLQAQTTLIDLQHERSGAWITLYRALGGGWNTNPADPARPLATAAAP